jgi:arsenate reductase-like glutaredoxin family protein
MSLISSPKLVDDLEGRFWTFEMDDGEFLTQPKKKRGEKRRHRAVRRLVQPLRRSRSSATAAVPPVNNEAASDDAENAQQRADVNQLASPLQSLSVKRQRQTDTPTRSTSQLNRQFKFYYWSSWNPQCVQLDSFLFDNGIPLPEKTNAAHQKMGKLEALEQCRKARTLFIVGDHGKLAHKIDMSDASDIDDEQLAKLVLDAEDNLRTPAIHVGGRIMIGYNAQFMRTHIFFGNAAASPAQKESRLHKLRKAVEPMSPNRTLTLRRSDRLAKRRSLQLPANWMAGVENPPGSPVQQQQQQHNTATSTRRSHRHSVRLSMLQF